MSLHKYWRYSDAIGACFVYDGENREVLAYICNPDIVNKASARRIVACVNYCMGLPLELLEAAVEYNEAPADAAWEPPHPIFKLAAERDRLRAAIVQLIQTEPEGIGYYEMLELINKGRAALEGET